MTSRKLKLCASFMRGSFAKRTDSAEKALNSVGNGAYWMFYTPAQKGEVVQGYLELSNADLANELAKDIKSQRSFQYMLRMITTSDEIETTVNNLR